MPAVFDRAVPAADAAYFTNGERAITVASDITAVPAGSYRLARYLNVRPGVYMLEAVIRPAGTLTISGVTLNVNGLIRTQIDVPQGNQRIDITLSNGSTGTCYAAFLLFQSDVAAYASSGDYWVWDTTTIADASIPALPDPRLSMPVMGVLPNWADGITERLTYSTAILESETGVEQRRAIRQHPRRSFEVSYLRSDVLRARLEHLLAGVGVREVLLPLWHEQYRTTAAIAPGAAFVQFSGDSLSLREFAAGDAVLLTNGDPLTQEVRILASLDVDAGRLNWLTPPTKAWPVGTRLVPLRKATITDKSSMTMHSDRVASVRVRLDLSDPMVVGADWGYCVPLWRFKVNRKDSMPLDFERKIYAVDNQSGPVRYSNPGNRLFTSTRVQTLTRGRVMMAELRQFIAAARGRAQGFWAPSGTQALVPLGDTIQGTFIEARKTGFREAMPGPQEPRRHIAIVFRDDAPTIYRKLTAVTEAIGVGNTPIENYVFDEPLPPIEVSRINRIEWVVPSRFDQDSFEFKHLVDQSAVVQSSFAFRSVDGSAMPDVSCDVTSLMYPLGMRENLEADFVPLSGALRDTPTPVEGLGAALVPLNSTLIRPLVTADAPSEGANVGLVPLGGTLAAPLVNLSAPSEGADTRMVPLNGTLVQVLLTYPHYAPEATDVTLVPMSGTLV